jgi:hypothetical protein
MGAEALIHLGVGPFERLENRNRRKTGRIGTVAGHFLFPQKDAGAKQAKEIIGEAGTGPEDREDEQNVMDHASRTTEERF